MLQWKVTRGTEGIVFFVGDNYKHKLQDLKRIEPHCVVSMASIIYCTQKNVKNTTASYFNILYIQITFKDSPNSRWQVQSGNF